MENGQNLCNVKVKKVSYEKEMPYLSTGKYKISMQIGDLIGLIL